MARKDIRDVTLRGVLSCIMSMHRIVLLYCISFKCMFVVKKYESHHETTQKTRQDKTRHDRLV